MVALHTTHAACDVDVSRAARRPPRPVALRCASCEVALPLGLSVLIVLVHAHVLLSYVHRACRAPVLPPKYRSHLSSEDPLAYAGSVDKLCQATRVEALVAIALATCLL